MADFIVYVLSSEELRAWTVRDEILRDASRHSICVRAVSFARSERVSVAVLRAPDGRFVSRLTTDYL